MRSVTAWPLAKRRRDAHRLVKLVIEIAPEETGKTPTKHSAAVALGLRATERRESDQSADHSIAAGTADHVRTVAKIVRLADSK
jgi:hypothetical protein